jgi:hypothetical protein
LVLSELSQGNRGRKDGQSQRHPSHIQLSQKCVRVLASSQMRLLARGGLSPFPSCWRSLPQKPSPGSIHSVCRRSGNGFRTYPRALHAVRYALASGERALIPTSVSEDRSCASIAAATTGIDVHAVARRLPNGV